MNETRLMKKLQEHGYESLTIEEMIWIEKSTSFRFVINDGKIKRMVYER